MRWLGLLGLLVYMSWCDSVYAQTVYTKQETQLNQCRHTGGACAIASSGIPNSDFTGVFSVAATQWTRWIQVDTRRTVTFDITFVDASAGITSIDMQCFTSQVTTGAPGAGFRLPVYTSTSAAGVTTSTPSIIRQVSTTGGAPGTSNWVWAVTNIPGAWIMCSFTANGVITAVVDTIDVNVRGITP